MPYRQPDLHAPRYRRPTTGTHNKLMYAHLRSQVAGVAHLSDEALSEVLSKLSQVAIEQVVNTREGVELPESLGHLFIGSCPLTKQLPLDRKASAELGEPVVRRNFETGELVAKIFYSNVGTRYHFKHRELWGFDPARKFSRLVSQVYPTCYELFLRVDPDRKTKHLFHTSTRKLVASEQRQQLLETYDEFAFDD